MLSIKLQDIRDRRAAGEKGFTLIELLVVVVIIGILVAIAIPLYLNYRNGAKNKSVQSDVRNAIPTVEQYYSDNGSYPAALPADVHVSDGNTLAYKLNGTTPASYCVSGINADTGKSWHITNTAAAGDLTSGKVTAGLCP